MEELFYRILTIEDLSIFTVGFLGGGSFIEKSMVSYNLVTVSLFVAMLFYLIGDFVATLFCLIGDLIATLIYLIGDLLLVLGLISVTIECLFSKGDSCRDSLPSSFTYEIFLVSNVFLLCTGKSCSVMSTTSDSEVFMASY